MRCWRRRQKLAGRADRADGSRRFRPERSTSRRRRGCSVGIASSAEIPATPMSSTGCWPSQTTDGDRPAYGVEYDPAWRNRAGSTKLRKIREVPTTTALTGARTWRCSRATWPWVACEFVHAEVLDSLEACEFERRAMIIWAQDRFTIGRGHHRGNAEPCWYVVGQRRYGPLERRPQSVLGVGTSRPGRRRT